MEKIALLYSGHLRSLNLAVKDLKRKHPEFLNPDITDVFCHTWSGGNKTAWEGVNKKRYLSGDIFTIEDLKKHMNVVSCIVEDYDSSPVGEITKQNNYIGSNFSIAYGSKKVYELFSEYSDKTKINYEIVIKTRVDTFFGRFPENPHGDWYQDHEKPDPLPLEYLKTKVKHTEDNIMIPWFEGCDHGGMTDQVIIGNKNSMWSICCLYYEWLKENYQKISHWHIETNFKKFVDNYKLNIERFNYHLGIIRTGRGFDEDNINWLGFRRK